MATRPPRTPETSGSPGRGGALASAPEPESKSGRLREAMAARLATLDDLSGEVLADRYALRRQIGRGGMGAVYLAEHVLIHKPVAVKVLGFEHSRRPRDIERFLQEARSASKIRHEHIVDITDFGYTPEGLAFLVMEYLDGEDLAVTCAREGRLPWTRTLAIGRQICGALAAAHAQGIIHRDMKLENCFRISRGDNDDFIKVLDFGIAKVVDDEDDSSGRAMTGSALVGTPEYVAPELVRGHKGDIRADIYAVGVILYKLLTGEVPLRGESYMATLTKQILEAPTPPRQRAPDAGIPPDLEAVVMRALEKEPERRYATIHEFGAALAGVAAVAPTAPSVLPPAPTGRRRLGRLVALVAVLAALVGAAALIVTRPIAGPEVADAADRDGSAAPAAEPTPPEPDPAAEPTPPEPDPEPEPAAEPDPDPDPEPEPSGASDERPERLSYQDFSAGLTAVGGAIKGCSKKAAIPGMKVQVRVRIGADGRVLGVEVLGSHSGTSLGECVARAVRRATFPPARAETTYTRTLTM